VSIDLVIVGLGYVGMPLAQGAAQSGLTDTPYRGVTATLHKTVTLISRETDMTSFEIARAAFAVLVPELTLLATAQFRHLEPEAQEEAVQNALALCWHAGDAGECRRADPEGTAGSR